ncbi:putative zinc finger protein [Apostichopus japonicus]|uniref:Putative zinc finger protein n=1 Tax=Stichopus japonicus TaxID=307972 RepID=A0A2G8L607_STIJA|nr:putative zinc finger protein [Apostichopus japonicus]
MRALCKQMYCPVCRADLNQVVFMNKHHLFKGIITHRFPRDRDTKIFFQNNRVRLEFNKLLQHQCALCLTRNSEGTFKMLQDHMRKDHELFYCELCLEHLKIFTSERKCYPRKDLAQHRRKGDADDTSYKGHPLCEFCDKRYFDNDELLKHLRRDHYFCHFCESSGVSNQYYDDYGNLKDHFQDSHYLCEEADCQFEQFSHAFASDIDLKAHRAAVHSKTFSKFQARQNRQIDVEINLPPRTRDRRGGGPTVGRGRAHLLRDDDDEEDTLRAMQASLQTSRAEEESKRRQKEEKVRKKNNNRKAPDEVYEQPYTDVRLSDPSFEESAKPRRNHSKVQAVEKTGHEDGKTKEEENVNVPVVRTDRDFPKLLDQEVDQTTPLVSSWGKPKMRVDDFPGLKPSAATTPSSSQSQTSGSWRPQKVGSLSEYPVLSGGGTTTTTKTGGSSKAAKTATVSQNVQSKPHNSKGGDSRQGQSVPRQVPPPSSAPKKKQVATNSQPPKFKAKPGEFPSLSSIATFLKNDSVPNRHPENVTDGRQSEWKRPTVERHTAPPKKEPKQKAPSSSFVPPEDYKDRNRALVHRIRKCLKDKDGGFDLFRTLSGQFRTNLLTAQDYYDKCLILLGDNFKKIFEELVSLLPDVEKQQELLRVHNERSSCKKSHQPDPGVLKISKNSSNAAWKDTPQNKHKTCTQCRQMVLLKDFEDHLNTHQDFPALTSSAPVKAKSGFQSQSAWGRMK